MMNSILDVNMNHTVYNLEKMYELIYKNNLLLKKIF